MNRMKLLVLFVSVMSVMTACTEDVPPSTFDEARLQKLLGTWKVSSVTVDGTIITDQYTNFVLTVFTDVSSKKLLATNGGYAFPFVGIDSWNFVEGAEPTKIKRTSDNVDITVSVSGQNLTLDFTIVAPPGGRVNGLEGHFVFVLVKT